MRKINLFLALTLIFFLSACEEIKHVKEFPKLKSDYEEAQKRINELEEKNAELESRLRDQESEPVFRAENKQSEQVKTLKSLLISEG